MKRRIAAGALIAAAALAAALVAYRDHDYRPRFARAAGELVAVRDSTGIGTAEDGKQLTEVTLVSNTSLEIRARVRAEGAPSGERYPAAILLGGYRTGRKAVDIPADTGNLVLLSIDYPYSGPERPRGLDWVRYFGTMRRAILDTPPAVLLAAQYLYTRRDVDPERVTIIGVSLGVPFSVAAAATDKRIAGAALLHGGGDIASMAYYAFADRGPAWVMRGAGLGAVLGRGAARADPLCRGVGAASGPHGERGGRRVHPPLQRTGIVRIAAATQADRVAGERARRHQRRRDRRRADVDHAGVDDGAGPSVKAPPGSRDYMSVVSSVTASSTSSWTS